MDKANVLDMLLRPELPNVRRNCAAKSGQKTVELLGEDVVFTLRALPYGKVDELRSGMGDDLNIQIVLAGVVEPNLRTPELSQRFGGVTPAETLKSMLLPGEIEDLSRAIERLCGYRTATIEEVKNA